MIGLNLAIIVLGLVQLFWLYKTWRNRGFFAALSLMVFGILNAMSFALASYKDGTLIL